MKIEFKKVDLSNIDEYGRLSGPDKKFNLLNAPYFKKETMQEHKEYIENLRKKLKSNEEIENNGRLIYSDNTMLGHCTWHWRSKETNWLELGIVIFEEKNWGKGIGSAALSKWIDYVFEIHPEIVRIGLTTWSGNVGMVSVSEKLGLKQEACFRKARIVHQKYYDSVSYGVLREEWESLKK